MADDVFNFLVGKDIAKEAFNNAGGFNKNNPFMKSQFVVEIDGLEIGGFQSVSAIEQKANFVEWHEGSGWNMTVKKIPSDSNCENITLKRLVMYDNFLSDWYGESTNNNFLTAQSKNRKRDLTIRIENNEKKLKIEVTGAFPVRYKIDELLKPVRNITNTSFRDTRLKKNQDIEALYEEIELACDGISFIYE